MKLVWLLFLPPFPLEPSDSQMNVLKAFQKLEPGDFTGFLKTLRSPSSQRLQSRCTAFLNTMEAYHVITISYWEKEKVPLGCSDRVFLCRLCQCRSSRTSCKTSTSPLPTISAVSAHRLITIQVVHLSQPLNCGFTCGFVFFLIFLFRVFRSRAHSDDGACGEAHHDAFAQVGILPWQLWRRAEGPDFAKEDTVSFAPHFIFNSWGFFV